MGTILQSACEAGAPWPEGLTRFPDRILSGLHRKESAE
jgi:hypothetical protein